MSTINEWITRKLFSYVHGNHLIYNACWEDPRLDREVLELGATDDLVLITSAGCNALDYALDGPRRIHAVDMNYRQNALLELKIAGIRTLDYEQFFELFGEGGSRWFKEWYHDLMRPELTLESRGYWDSRLYLFDRVKEGKTFYHRTTSGFIARSVVRYLKLAEVYSDALRLFAAESVEEQRAIYFGRMQQRFWRPSFKRALRTDTLLSCLGVPRAQRDYLEKSCMMSVADFVERCVETVLTRLSVRDNYFWRVYLFGSYTAECCPEYLKPENYHKLKAGLADRIEIHTNHLTGFLRAHPTPITRFVLLDHMDWLSNQDPRLLQAEWQAILDRAGKGARMLWRSAGFHVDYVDPIKVQYRGRPIRVGEVLRYDEASAKSAHARDRVHTYGSFYIADLAA